MIIINRYIRAYYEINGSFNGIENLKYYSKIKEFAEKENVSILEYCYRTLGYLADGNLSAEQRFMFRKRDAKQKTATLMKELQVKNITDLDDVLKTLKCKAYIATKADKVNHIGLVNMLSLFYKTNETLVQMDEGVLPFNQILTIATLATKKHEISSFFKHSTLKDTLKRITPKWIKSENNFINGGFIHTNEELSVKERNMIVTEACKDAALNTTKVSIETRLTTIDLVGRNIITLAETDVDKYLTILDIAHGLSITVAQLLQYCNLNHIDSVTQIDTMGCSVVAYEDNSVILHGLDSSRLSEYVILNNEDFVTIHNRDLLKSLQWVDGICTVSVGNRRPLSSLFVADKTNDIRR